MFPSPASSTGRSGVRMHLRGAASHSASCLRALQHLPSFTIIVRRSVRLFLAPSRLCAAQLLAFINRGRSSFGVQGRPVGTAVTIATEDYNFCGWATEHQLRKVVGLGGISDVVVLRSQISVLAPDLHLHDVYSSANNLFMHHHELLLFSTKHPRTGDVTKRRDL